METKVKKWGNSLAVRIPKAYAEQLGLAADDHVRILVDGERLVIESVRQVTLDSLLAEITPDTVHAETDWGVPMGNEVW